jgi:MOSC domain-containing protein YiiM
MATVTAIWIKRAHGGPMDPVAEAELVAGRGIVGNADQGSRRQVTVISEEAWGEAVAEVGVDVPPRARRANILVRGVDLHESRGKILRLGECVIRLVGESRPCEQMDEAQPGLRRALGTGWRGGVFGEVLEGGRLRVGDAAALESLDGPTG